MPADPAPLYAIAAELETRAALLRIHAARVGTAPAGARWSSAGAQAWAASVAEIHRLLLRSADEVEQTAAQFRARATEVCSWD